MQAGGRAGSSTAAISVIHTSLSGSLNVLSLIAGGVGVKTVAITRRVRGNMKTVIGCTICKHDWGPHLLTLRHDGTILCPICSREICYVMPTKIGYIEEKLEG